MGRQVICYVCSRTYGSKSIAIHEPNCLQKWHQENKKLPRKLQQEVPQRPCQLPSGETTKSFLGRYNDAAWDTSQATLAPCDNCGRTFVPDRLPLHQKCCTANNPMKPVKKVTPSRPSSVSNITVHLPCQKKSCLVCLRSKSTCREQQRKRNQKEEVKRERKLSANKSHTPARDARAASGNASGMRAAGFRSTSSYSNRHEGPKNNVLLRLNVTSPWADHGKTRLESPDTKNKLPPNSFLPRI